MCGFAVDPDLKKVKCLKSPPEWSKEEINDVKIYRAAHPCYSDEYTGWPVAVALLQQPYVAIRDDEEAAKVEADLQQRERYIGEAKNAGGTRVRYSDEWRWRKILLDEHKAAKLRGLRPAREGDEAFDRALEDVVQRLKKCWIVYCRRQVVDGTDLVEIIEAWVYVPGHGSWMVEEYRGTPRPPAARM